MPDNIDNEKKLVDFIVDEFGRYEKACKDRFDEAKIIYDYWCNKPSKRYFDWQNAVHVPMMVEAEQTVTPKLHSALFPNDAPFEVLTFKPATEEQGIIIKGMLEHKFRQANVSVEALRSMTQTTLFGTGYVEAPWLVERAWQIDPMTQERYMALINNRPDCKTVSFFEIFPHPAKLRMDDGLPLIRRQFCDAEYLKKLSENPRFKFDNLTAALESKSVVSSPSIILDEHGHAQDLKDREKYELLTYWGGYDQTYLKNDKPVIKKAVPHWIIVVNRAVLARSMPNPYNHQQPPYCKITLFEDPNPSWFGVGIGKIGKPTQERLNKIVNQRLDNVDLVLNKQGFYNGNDTLINTKKLQVSKPGQWHKVSDTVTSIRWMDIPDVTTSSYKEEEIAKQDFRESTGATMQLMPAEEGQHRTAMGISLLQGAAGSRFKPVLRKMESDFIASLAQLFLSMLQQFMVLPEWIQVTGNNGASKPVQVRPEIIQAKVQFLPTGVSETINKEMQIGQLLRFKELTMNDPTVNRVEINKRIAELMGFRDIQKLLTPPPPDVKPGGLDPRAQDMVRQRLAEGASPEQIKMEMLGPPPGPEEMQPEGAANG
jgi:hypothetical protein